MKFHELSMYPSLNNTDQGNLAEKLWNVKCYGNPILCLANSVPKPMSVSPLWGRPESS
jgi:hypothetical protein